MVSQEVLAVPADSAWPGGASVHDRKTHSCGSQGAALLATSHFL